MPGWSIGSTILLRTNQQGIMFNNELVTVGELSVAFQLERISRSFYPWGASFEAVFSGNPGTFEIDIMGANSDQEANYLQLGSMTTATSIVNGNYVARYDMASNLWPKYVAAYVKTFPNFATVKVFLQATR